MPDLSIEELDQVLKSWRGRAVRVGKLEQADVDQVEMDLEEVTYYENERSIDDYVGRYVLQLQGAGSVQPEMGVALASLPGRAFEIPLTENDRYTLQGSRLTIQTPRARYVLEADPSGRT